MDALIYTFQRDPWRAHVIPLDLPLRIGSSPWMFLCPNSNPNPNSNDREALLKSVIKNDPK